MVAGAITRVQDWSWLLTQGRENISHSGQVFYIQNAVWEGNSLFALSTTPQNVVFKKTSVQQKLCLPQEVMHCKASRCVGQKSWCWAFWTHCAWLTVWVCEEERGLFFGLALVHQLPSMDAHTGKLHTVENGFSIFVIIIFTVHFHLFCIFFDMSHLFFLTFSYFYHSSEVSRTLEKISCSHMDSPTTNQLNNCILVCSVSPGSMNCERNTVKLKCW